ncbi:MAG: nitrite transporter [Fusobacteriaceae bacterium]|jgi:nitrite transporter NirC|nr:formate/nitrite transporter [Fusobacteriales bacterium]MDN5303373.1 nitrite transporter [Fusobacteriaceae bacterium]
MYSEVVEKLGNAAIAKKNFLKGNKIGYIIGGLLAGLYVGLGIILIMTVGSLAKPSGPQFKILMGVSFGVALSLVIMAGSELFTGNNLIMAAGALEKKVSWIDAVKIWIFSYFGNLLGSTLVGSLFLATGSVKPDNALGQFILGLSKAKMTAPASNLFFKGILCNILVCLAVLCAVKMKEETGKLIMIWWALFAFITSGFEHSIANMTIFTMGVGISNIPEVSLAGYAHNMLWVTLGNMVGGIGLAFCYYLMGKKSK